MRGTTKDFWGSLRTGVEVAVASTHGEKLLGVRDGFRRYFAQQLEKPLAVVVVPQDHQDGRLGLPTSDEATLELAQGRARHLFETLEGYYHFYVASEGGLHSLELGGQSSYFVRNWTVVVSAHGEAWGGSGSVQLPDRLIQGLGNDEIPFAVPGTRRGGGMLSSLTSGLETRRSAVASATLNALSSLFYGILEGKPNLRKIS